MARRGGLWSNRTVPIIFVSLMTIFVMFPLLWVFSVSFRLPGEVFESYFFIIPRHFSIENYWAAIQLVATRGPGFLTLYQNSTIVTLVSTAICLMVSALCAYGFTIYSDSRTVQTNYYLMIIYLTIPTSILMIPSFVIANFFEIYNTLYSLIAFYVATQMPLSIFILAAYLKTIPVELRQAAQVDGASEFSIFSRIYLPLSKPALATTAAVAFFLIWNEFPLALVLISEPSRMTLPLGMAVLLGRFGSVTGPGLGSYCAALVLGFVPIFIVYIVAQRWLVRGLTVGAVKG